MSNTVVGRPREDRGTDAGPRGAGSTALLARRLEAECATAVDPMQVAAVLEADGVTDHLAADWYGHRNVFDLAETLYAGAPLRVEPFQPLEEESPRAWRDLIRGFLFVLPGLLYLAALPGLGTPPSLEVLVGGLVFAWVWAQIGGYFGHTLEGRKAHRRARRIALRFAAAGSGIAVIVAGVGVGLLDLAPADALVFVGQTVYLLSASVLLLFRKEHVLLAILVPGAAISLGVGLNASSQGGQNVAIVVAVATIVATAVAAFGTTSALVDISGAKLTQRDVRGVVPHALLALSWAVLVSMAIVVPMDAGGDSTIGGFAVVPLLLSMGVAEWALRRYLTQTDRALRTTHERYTFARRALMITWQSVTLYALAITGLSVAVAAVVAQSGDLGDDDVVMLLALGCLGMAFLLGQILASRLRIHVTVILSLTAAIGATMVLSGYIDIDAGDESVYLVATALLAAGLLIPASTAVRRATTYR